MTGRFMFGSRSVVSQSESSKYRGHTIHGRESNLPDSLVYDNQVISGIAIDGRSTLMPMPPAPPNVLCASWEFCVACETKGGCDDDMVGYSATGMSVLDSGTHAVAVTLESHESEGLSLELFVGPPSSF